MKHFILRLLAGCIGIAVGIYFRDFWRSECGPPTLIFLASLSVTVAFGWRGKGKPWAFRTGLIFGLGTAITLTATYLVNLYAGVAVMIVLLFLAHRTGFFERWATKQ